MSEPTGAAVAEKPKAQTDDTKSDGCTDEGWQRVLLRLDGHDFSTTATTFTEAQIQGVEGFANSVKTPARVSQTDYLAIAVDVVFSALLSAVAGKLGAIVGGHVAEIVRKYGIDEHGAEQVQRLAAAMSKSIATKAVLTAQAGSAQPNPRHSLLKQFTAKQKGQIRKAKGATMDHINQLAREAPLSEARAALMAVKSSFRGAFDVISHEQTVASTEGWLELVAHVNSTRTKPNSPTISQGNPDVTRIPGPIDVYGTYVPSEGPPVGDEVWIERCESAADIALLETLSGQPIAQSHAPFRFHITIPDGRTIHFGRNSDGRLELTNWDISPWIISKIGHDPDLPNTPDDELLRGMRRLNTLIGRGRLFFPALDGASQ